MVEYIYPNELKGPRAYFTLFDINNVKQYASVKDYHKEIERILKVLLLIKENIVVAATHFTYPSTFDFFQDKAFLLQDKLILVALRNQFKEYSELHAEKDTKGVSPHIKDFFSQTIKGFVPWDLKENSSFFCSLIQNEIENVSSYTRVSLRQLPKGRVYEKMYLDLVSKQLQETAESQHFFSRETFDKSLKNTFRNDPLEIVNSFSDLAYFISGANAVNCENYLPQQNFAKATSLLTNDDFSLHEFDIFHNVVLRLILKIAYENSQYVDILDNISLEEIYQLRKQNELKSQEFRNKYENCLTLVRELKVSKDKEYILPRLDTLKKVAIEIREHFEKVIQEELLEYRTSKDMKKQSDETVSTALDVVDLFDLAGFLPKINTVLNNVYVQKIPIIKQLANKKEAFQEHLIRKMVKNYYKDDPIILSYFEDLINLHKNNYLNIKR